MNKNKKVEACGKFQKDLDNFLPVYSMFVVEGATDDFQLIQCKSIVDGKERYRYKIVNDFVDYLQEVYQNIYLIFCYDISKIEGNRFSSPQDKDELSDSDADRFEAICKILGINQDGVDYKLSAFISRRNESDDDQQEEVGNKPNQLKRGDQSDQDEKNKIKDIVENTLKLSHSNSGISLDISKIHSIVTSKELNNPKKPILMVLKNSSRWSYENGDSVIQSSRDNEMYSSLLFLSQEMSKLFEKNDNQDYILENNFNKIILLANSNNDFPEWFVGREKNPDVKCLKIDVPDKEHRIEALKFFVTEANENCESSSGISYLNKLFSSYEGEDKQKESPELEKIGTLTEGFDFRRLYKFVNFVTTLEVSLEESPKKVVEEFVYGAETVNPWSDAHLFDKIKKFDTTAKKELKGQDEAIERVKAILGDAVTGINRVLNPNAPRAVLFLAGPTGTGKTEISKLISKTIFGDEKKMIRFDMSEYSVEGSDSKLFGSAPGYVGYKEGGKLTNAMLENPFRLVLFDEIEKANPRIMDKFLQILSDGRLTSGKGETVDFKDAIIVMTSNAGLKSNNDKNSHALVSEELEKAYIANNVLEDCANIQTLIDIEEDHFSFDEIKAKGTSYASRVEKIKENHRFENKEEYQKWYKENLNAFVISNLSNYFDEVLQRKEIYGRLFDSIIVYNYISKDAAKDICENTLEKFIKNLRKDKKLCIDTNDKSFEEVKKFLINKSTSPAVRDLGGRGVVKTFAQLFSSPISKAILDNGKNIYENEMNLVVILDRDELGNEMIKAEIRKKTEESR